MIGDGPDPARTEGPGSPPHSGRILDAQTTIASRALPRPLLTQQAREAFEHRESELDIASETGDTTFRATGYIFCKQSIVSAPQRDLDVEDANR